MATKPGETTGAYGHVTERRWRELIEQCRQAVESQTGLQFQLGEAALEIEPLQPSHEGRSPNSLEPGVGEILESFAEEVGVETATLLTYRSTAAAWPRKRRRKHVSFTVHEILSSLPDRFEVIGDPPDDPHTGRKRWTCETARRYVGRQVAYPQDTRERLGKVRSLTSEDTVAASAAEDLLSRPDVADRVVSNPATWNKLSRARVERDAEIQHQARERTPAIAAVEQRTLVADLLGSCTEFVAAINRTVPQLQGQLTDDDQDAVHEALDRVRTAADWCRDAVDTGDTSLSDQIAEFLRGEEP